MRTALPRDARAGLEPGPGWMRTAALALALISTVALLAGCTSSSDSPEPAASTPLASYATESLTVARGDFCDRIGSAAVTRALGGEAEKTTHYTSGVPTEMEVDLVDLSHEFGCRFTTPDATARAWVFAPPITNERAKQAIASLTGMDRCVVLPDAPAFGQPTIALACGDQAKPTVWFAGLFGDAWLTCTLERALPGPELLDETGRWCVAVADAAAE